jgi:hypothetical protein
MTSDVRRATGLSSQRGNGELAILLGLGGVFVVFIGGILLLGDLWGRYQCSNFEKITGKQTRYATMDICYINTKDGWQRWDEYKLRAAASEGLKEMNK